MPSTADENLRRIATRLSLARPLVFLDLETTGVSTDNDRIVEIATSTVDPNGTVRHFASLVNPGVPIPAGASSVHHITDDDVRDKPRFADLAPALARDLEGCDFAGFNVDKFDLPMLAVEFARAKVLFRLEDHAVVDVMSIYFKNERRDLEAAVKFYCSRAHHGHRALEDVSATIDVFAAQLERYGHLPTEVPKLAEYCAPRGERLTSDGKIIWRNGEAAISFGKHRGRTLRELVRDAPDYLRWLIGTEFPDETKRVVSAALGGEFPKHPSARS